TAGRRQPRSAVPLRRGRDRAAHPCPDAAGRCRHERRSGCADRRPPGAAAGRPRRTPTDATRSIPAGAGRCVGKPGAQALRTMKPRWILHVDLDQFLASVELGRHPELVGLPVIVGGSGDPTEARKVVTCASYEAREFGVHAGMPLRSAARRCPDATFLPSDPPAYDAASERVMALLRDLGHPLEVWGWDEAYLGADVDDPVELAERIRTTIAAE